MVWIPYSVDMMMVWIPYIAKLSRIERTAVKAHHGSFHFSDEVLAVWMRLPLKSCTRLCRSFGTTKWDYQEAFLSCPAGGGITEAEALVALPTSLAGLGIYDPTKIASSAYQTSRQGTNVIVEAVKGVDVFDPTRLISREFQKTPCQNQGRLMNLYLKRFWWSSLQSNKGPLEEQLMAAWLTALTCQLPLWPGSSSI